MSRDELLFLGQGTPVTIVSCTGWPGLGATADWLCIQQCSS